MTDLQISVHSSPIHPTGAIEKLTRVLLPFVLEWRRSLPRGDPPRCPSLQLFRQAAPLEAHGGTIGEALDVGAAPYPDHSQPIEQLIADAGLIWDRIVTRHGLDPLEVDHLASW